MRTTLTLPDDLVREAEALAAGRSFSEFAREALRERIERLRREQIAREMEEGYRAEAARPSLDSEWTATELDDW